MLAITTILLLAATAASAELNDVERTWFAVGPNYNMIQVNNQTRSLLDDARTHPNLTRSVKFNPYDTVLESQWNNDIKFVEWEWRVNVSEFAVPNARLPDKPDTIPRMISTTYDISWPSGGNMSEQLKNDTVPFCVRAHYFDKGLSRNVTNAFTEEDADDTSCSSVLGTECVSAIMQQELMVNGTCQHPDTPWSRLPACSDSFGFSVEDRKAQATMWGMADLNGPRNGSDGTDWQYQSGGQIFSSTTSIFDPGADDAGRLFRNESRALQVIVLSTVPPSENKQEAVKLLCMRVDTADFEGSAARPLLGLGSLAVVLLATALVMGL
ncbi:hypothetical protein F5X68DRAFT_228347 [Plectosphaerella plurivora]|uniref:Uncharacterized protein n=1 Tax=Plectosphaerella plurivora TaxID=936078 RepID=A0A9P8VKM9_9PEZI|nr:hypothetical protein F5X68DRAFT_228347 [Plectosphaerella plurivora]